MKINIKLLHAGAKMPTRAHHDDAGADIYFSGDVETLRPGERRLLSTGVSVEIPYGYVGLIHPRSGLAHKYGLTVTNTPGTIDAGYRGEVKMNMINLGQDVVIISHGDRIAQLLIQKVELVDFEEVGNLVDSSRGEKGFGSTGS